RQHHRQSAAAESVVRRPSQSGRSAHCQAAALRQQAAACGDRSLQSAQRQSRVDLRPDVQRNGRDVAASNNDLVAAVCTVQRDVHLLTGLRLGGKRSEPVPLSTLNRVLEGIGPFTILTFDSREAALQTSEYVDAAAPPRSSLFFVCAGRDSL